MAFTLFFVVLVFRKILLRRAYLAPAAGEEALLEYFVQQNTGSEEEIATELLENALQLKTVRAHDCMAPRPDIVYIDAKAKVEELRRLMIESSLSRIIVVDGELDQVLGYVHVQQLFNRPRRIRDMVLPISFVPESISINDLLHKFIRSRSSIACVVDEYGSLTGLVTLEDALEQLFGDIDDEHDQEEFIEARVSDQEFIFSGRLKVDYLNEKYPELHIPPGDYNTLSGFLVTTTKTIPAQGVRLELDGVCYILELVSDRKIETVRVLI
ncbi:MAG: CBS domain-containing protein [Saprospiraceae bacterium]|nr:CBS domain-containing protein [Saprospiraceae bacterium]